MFGRCHGFKVCTLSGGLHRGRKVQTRLFEIAYAGVREECKQNQQNRGDIFQGELLRSGTCNPISMDISATNHLGHRRRVCGSGEDDLGKRFALPFLQKDENSLPVVGFSN